MSERLHVFSEYGLAVVGIECGDLDRFQYESGDTEGLVNKVLGLAGVRVAIMAREAEPGLIKLSLRSVEDFSVRDLAAAEFDGGGHKNAAGGIVKGKTIPEFIAFVKTRLSDWIDVS
jgi:phosphoesterase RecJ-like protein